MKIQEITYTNFDNIEVTYIEIQNEDDSITTFIKDPANSVYAAWLAQQEAQSL